VTTLNDISPDRVARLVSGHLPLDATRREHEIAGKLRKLGEEMERKGYLPDLRRREMRRRMLEMVREAGR
jgi:hypothetical protein